MDNLTLRFKVKHQNISRLDLLKLASGSRNYVKASFDFSEDWDGTTKTARFKCNDEIYDVLLDDNTCLIPWEAIAESGFFEVSVFGGDLITVDTARVYVIESSYTNGGYPVPPTPSIYEQVIAKLEEIEAQINPEAVRTEVEAILAEKKIVTEDTVDEIVNDILAGKNLVTKSELTSAVDTAFESHKSEFVTPDNVKTINGNSIIGQGNIEIQGGGSGSVEMPITLTVTTMNVGGYNSMGSSGHGTQEQVIQYMNLFSQFDADIVGLQEDKTSYDGTRNTVDVIYNKFFPYYYKGTNGYMASLCSRLALQNVAKTKFEADANYHYTEGDLVLNGKTIKVISMHTPFRNNGNVSDEVVLSAHTQIINHLSTLDYFILLGDFNPKGLGDAQTTWNKVYKWYYDAGFNVANNVIWGDVISDENIPCDNIVTSNNIKIMSLEDIDTITSGLTDHKALVAKLLVTNERQQTEPLNPSSTPTEKTLSSISATKTTTTYNVGDTVSTSDVVVTASYSDGSSANVTSSANIGTVDTSTSGTKSLNISYTEDGVTRTTSISIIVSSGGDIPTIPQLILDKGVGSYQRFRRTNDASKYFVFYTDSLTLDIPTPIASGSNASWNYASPNGNYWVFESTDGGATWTTLSGDAGHQLKTAIKTTTAFYFSENISYSAITFEDAVRIG